MTEDKSALVGVYVVNEGYMLKHRISNFNDPLMQIKFEEPTKHKLEDPHLKKIKKLELKFDTLQNKQKNKNKSSEFYAALKARTKINRKRKKKLQIRKNDASQQKDYNYKINAVKWGIMKPLFLDVYLEKFNIENRFRCVVLRKNDKEAKVEDEELKELKKESNQNTNSNLQKKISKRLETIFTYYPNKKTCLVEELEKLIDNKRLTNFLYPTNQSEKQENFLHFVFGISLVYTNQMQFTQYHRFLEKLKDRLYIELDDGLTKLVLVSKIHAFYPELLHPYADICVFIHPDFDPIPSDELPNNTPKTERASWRNQEERFEEVKKKKYQKILQKKSLTHEIFIENMKLKNVQKENKFLEEKILSLRKEFQVVEKNLKKELLLGNENKKLQFDLVEDRVSVIVTSDKIFSHNQKILIRIDENAILIHDFEDKILELDYQLETAKELKINLNDYKVLLENQKKILVERLKSEKRKNDDPSMREINEWGNLPTNLMFACLICNRRRREIIYKPCLHMFLCNRCNFIQKQNMVQTCLVCKEIITESYRVTYSN